MLSSITALFIVRSLWFSWLKVLNCLKRDWGQSTQNPNSQKAFLFQCIDNCAISNTTLALASRGHSRCVTISYCHCWTLCCFHRIGERCWWWWSTKVARGAELQYLRQLWHGGEARSGCSDSIWFDLNRTEAELTQERGRCRNVTQRRIASQRHICCSFCQ